jgi:AcrR family transcriptional regulator
MELMTADGEDADAGRPAGLRERSKARRRGEIQRAAMRLFAEFGYDSATVADIASAAEVAPRTVTGYFPSKADLALSYADEIATRVTEMFAAHPDTGFFDVIEMWLRGEKLLLDPPTAALANAMYEANPSIRALSSAHVARALDVAVAALAAEVGRPADDPVMAVCGATSAAAVGAYLAILAQRGASEEFHQSFMAYLRAMVDAARAG